MKTKIKFEPINDQDYKYKVYYKESFIDFWHYEKNFDTFEEADNYAKALSNSFTTIYKNGVKIKGN